MYTSTHWHVHAYTHQHVHTSAYNTYFAGFISPLIPDTAIEYQFPWYVCMICKCVCMYIHICIYIHIYIYIYILYAYMHPV